MIGRFWVSFLWLTPVRNKILKKAFWSFEVTAIFGTLVPVFFVIVNKVTTFFLYIWVAPNLCFLLSFFLYARFYEHMGFLCLVSVDYLESKSKDEPSMLLFHELVFC